MDGLLRPVRSEWLLQRLAPRIAIVATIAIVAVFLRQCFFNMLRICRIHSSRIIIECRHTYWFRVYRTVVLLMIAIRVARFFDCFLKEKLRVLPKLWNVSSSCLRTPLHRKSGKSTSETETWYNNCYGLILLAIEYCIVLRFVAHIDPKKKSTVETPWSNQRTAKSEGSVCLSVLNSSISTSCIATSVGPQSKYHTWSDKRCWLE